MALVQASSDPNAYDNFTNTNARPAPAQAGPPTAAPSGSVYWVGADGNAYYGNGQGGGVQNMGRASNATAQGFDSPTQSVLARQISDPNAPRGTTTSSGSGGRGYSAAAPAPTVPQATIDSIMAGIAQQVSQHQQDFQNATTQNQGADANDLAKYTANTTSNNESHSSAIQNAEQAAAQGGQGLRAILASMGALGGTGQVLANRAVSNSANNDIGGADKTYQTNAESLQGAQNDYLNAAKARDITLQNALSNDNASVKGAGIQNILNAANSVGDKATYEKFLPQLVSAQAAPQAIAPQPIVSNPATVNSYAPTSGLRVTSQAPANAASTTPVNSALYVKKNS